MEFDNKLRTGKFRMAYIIFLTMSIVLTAYYFIEYNSDFVENSVLTAIALFILIYIFMLILRLNYFYINDSGLKLTVKYYTAHPFFRKYKVFEIPKSLFADYKIEKSFFGFKQDLILVAKTRKGNLKFPKVSISGLSKKEKEILKIIFKKYLIKKKQIF